MNKGIYFFRKHLLSLTGILAAAVILAACSKNNDDAPSIPAAGVMAFNLAPDQESVTVSLSGSTITQAPLNYNGYTGYYQNIFTGPRPVEAFDFPNTSPLTSSTYTFEQNTSYSLFVVGAKDHYRNVIAIDSVDQAEIATGKTYVRYINAIPDSSAIPNVTIAIGGTEVVNQAAPYTTVSGFKAVTPGTVSVSISNSGNINVSRNINLEEGKAYTVLLSGLPEATDELKKVQIKFIQNGTVSAQPSENNN